MDELKEMRDLRFKCLQIANCFENESINELMEQAEQLFIFCMTFQIIEKEEQEEINSSPSEN